MNKQSEILIYTSKNCAFCNSAKELLTNKKLKFKEINISKNNNLKEEMITYFKGMKGLENAAFSSTYKTVWCAGPSIEHTNQILPIKKIVEKFISL